MADRHHHDLMKAIDKGWKHAMPEIESVRERERMIDYLLFDDFRGWVKTNLLGFVTE